MSYECVCEYVMSLAHAHVCLYGLTSVTRASAKQVRLPIESTAIGGIVVTMVLRGTPAANYGTVCMKYRSALVLCGVVCVFVHSVWHVSACSVPYLNRTILVYCCCTCTSAWGLSVLCILNTVLLGL